MFRRLLKFDAHHRVAVALVFSLLVFALTCPWLPFRVSVILAWNAFAICSLTFAWAGMIFTDVRTCLHEAHLQDSSRTAICGCVVAGSATALFGAGLMLEFAKVSGAGSAGRYISLAGLTVASSWLLVHTMLTLHYTHLCCHIAKNSDEKPPSFGVVFPNEPRPDFLDFAYFSFVIGMTCQVSDVQITSRRIRRIALLHGLISFGFNTVILAISLNLAAALL